MGCKQLRRGDGGGGFGGGAQAAEARRGDGGEVLRSLPTESRVGLESRLQP